MEQLFLRAVEEGIYSAVLHSSVENVNVKDASGNSAVHLATAYGNIDMLRILIEKGCDLFAVNSKQETVLHIAVYTRNVALIEFLLESKCDKKAKCIKNETAKDIAIRLGYTELLHLLEE